MEKKFPYIKGVRLVVVAKKGILDIPFEEISKGIYNIVKNIKKEKPDESCFDG